MSVQLPTDVYSEQFDFVELVRDVTTSIESQGADDIVRPRVQLILAMIGRDLLKLHTLVEVVNVRIESQLTWATAAAVKFYRALFDNIDPTLELDTFCGDSIMGAEIAAKYILETAEKLLAQPIWGHGFVNVLEFSASLLRACSSGEHESAIAENLGCGLFERMAKSLYLPFNDNYDTFFRFAHEVVLMLDMANKSGKSVRVTGILEALKNEDYERNDQQKIQLEQLYNRLGRSDLYQKHTETRPYGSLYGQDLLGLIPCPELEKEVVTSSELFTTTLDWEWPPIDRLLKSISQVMKIDAPLTVQTATLNIIEVMVHSKSLFLYKNLQILIFFIFSVAPALDAMAHGRQSDRLTALLNHLSIHRGVQTYQDRDSIDGLRGNLGRMMEDVAPQSLGERFEEDELLGAVSELDID